MLKKTTARLIITLKCPRDCWYCANKSQIGLSIGTTIYKENLEILKKNNPTQKIYIYSAWYNFDGDIEDIHNIIELSDGINYSLHQNSNYNDISGFHNIQLALNSFSKKSNRLNMLNDSKGILHITMETWDKIEKKKVILDTCNIPENEDLFILKEK